MSIVIEHGIPKERCEEMIKGLVCRGCGNSVVAILTVDNAGNPTYWGGCHGCNTIDWGTTPLIFQIAKKLVEERHFRPYSGARPFHLSEEDFLKSQIRGACSTVADVLKIHKEIKT